MQRANKIRRPNAFEPSLDVRPVLLHSPIAATSVESLIAYLREAKVLRSKISTLKGASGSGRHTKYSYNAFTSQGGKLKHFGELLADIVMPDLADVETECCLHLAERLLEATAVPRTSFDDATHIATAAISGMDYLVTWNCSHIANAQTRPLIRKVLAEEGAFALEICTPLELTGGSDGN